jgi:hypothetical protein
MRLRVHPAGDTLPKASARHFLPTGHKTNTVNTATTQVFNKLLAIDTQFGNRPNRHSYLGNHAKSQWKRAPPGQKPIWAILGKIRADDCWQNYQ